MDQAGPTPGFLRRNLRRHRLALATLLWFAAVYFYWREFIPLRVALLPTPPAGLRWWGFTADGQMTLAGRKDNSFPFHGPLQLWDPKSQSITQTFFDESHTVFCQTTNPKLVVGQRYGIRTFVRLKDSKVLFSRPVGSPTEDWAFSDDEQFVWFVDGMTITLCRTEDGTELWTKTGFNDVQFPGPDVALLIVDTMRPPKPPRGEHLFVNAITGEADPRQPEAFGWIRTVSADGKWMITHSPTGDAYVRGYETGKIIWQLPAGLRPEYFGISNNSTEVRFGYRSGSRHGIARWDITTGRALTPLPPDGAEPVYVWESGGDYFLALAKEEVIVPDAVLNVVNRLGLRWSGRLLENRYGYHVIESSTGRNLGFVENNSSYFGDINASGFFQYRISRSFAAIQHCPFPPKYSWSWLAAWSLTPPMGVWLLRAVGRGFSSRIQRRRPEA